MCPYKFYSNCHLTCTTVNHQSSNFSLPLHFSPLYFSLHIHVSYVYTIPPQINPARTLHSLLHPCIYSNITSCQGASKTRRVCDVWVPAELQHIYDGSLKGNRSLLNA